MSTIDGRFRIGGGRVLETGVVQSLKDFGEVMESLIVSSSNLVSRMDWRDGENVSRKMQTSTSMSTLNEGYIVGQGRANTKIGIAMSYTSVLVPQKTTQLLKTAY